MRADMGRPTAKGLAMQDMGAGLVSTARHSMVLRRGARRSVVRLAERGVPLCWHAGTWRSSTVQAARDDHEQA